MKAAIKAGDRVAYSADWLRSIGAFTGPLPFARGKVTAIAQLGETQLATIDWEDAAIPTRVNTANLIRVADIGKGPH